MWLEVNPRLSVPIYQQIVDGVKAAVAKGVLQSGDKIPSIRELAVELMLNHNTVAKAYQTLEREHVIEVLRGRGTFVSTQSSIPNRRERAAEIQNTMRKLLIEAHHLQISEKELLEMFRTVITDWHKQGERDIQEDPHIQENSHNQEKSHNQANWHADEKSSGKRRGIE